jgi:hypothetical protein
MREESFPQCGVVYDGNQPVSRPEVVFSVLSYGQSPQIQQYVILPSLAILPAIYIYIYIINLCIFKQNTLYSLANYLNNCLLLLPLFLAISTVTVQESQNNIL